MRSSYQSIGGSDDDDAHAESSDEDDDVQNEVDRIVNNVMSLDLGDARSNKDMKNRVNRFQEENARITE